MTDAQAVARLRKATAGERGAIKAWAEAKGLNYTYVVDVLSGRRPMSDTVAGALGLKRVHGWTERGEK